MALGITHISYIHFTALDNSDLQALDVEAKDAWTLFKLMDVSGCSREKTRKRMEIKKEKPMENPSWCGTWKIPSVVAGNAFLFGFVKSPWGPWLFSQLWNILEPNEFWDITTDRPKKDGRERPKVRENGHEKRANGVLIKFGAVSLSFLKDYRIYRQLVVALR